MIEAYLWIGLIIMLMEMQKEIEVLQRSQNKITENPHNFIDFVRKIEYNLEKSLLNKRNLQLLRQKIKDNLLFKSKIIPPTFDKIGQENIPPRPKIFISPPIFNNSQTCPVTQIDINSSLGEHSVHSSLEKQARAQCKTSYEGFRKLGSYNRIKSSWKVQFRLDELNVLQYQKKKNNDESSEWFDKNNCQKSFKVRKVLKKFEEMKHKSCKIYKTNKQIEEKGILISKRPERTFESSSIYRSRSPQ